VQKSLMPKGVDHISTGSIPPSGIECKNL